MCNINASLPTFRNLEPDTCRKEAEDDSNAHTGSPLLITTQWDNEVSRGRQPLSLKKFMNVGNCCVC